MSGKLWTPAELKKLQAANKAREPWMTDMDIARTLSGQLHKSQEAIRWQLRMYRKDVFPSLTPKVLLMDIETLPMEGKFWQPWGNDIQPHQVTKNWSMVCWSAKWLFDSKVYGEAVSGEEAVNRQDKSIMGGLWTMMNEATHVVTHNGEEFDFKKMNTRLLVNGFPRPMPYRSIDTLKILKANFAFPYNKMDEVNKTLGMPRKIETSWKWWDECSDGNETYINKMLVYNKQDVHILEELYLRLRPWMTNAPNMNLYDISGATVCPACSSPNIHWNGVYTTPKNVYQAFRCQDCGAIGRSSGKNHKVTSTKAGG